MITVDSSVAIAGFASWHERHAEARKILGRQSRLVAHAALEAYSVLTRLPPPHRAQADLVARFLRGWFPDRLLYLPEHRQQDLVGLLAQRQIVGGQVYDALIGLTAAEHGATLISFDQRAALVYKAVGARVDVSA